MRDFGLECLVYQISRLLKHYMYNHLLPKLFLVHLFLYMFVFLYICIDYTVVSFIEKPFF